MEYYTIEINTYFGVRYFVRFATHNPNRIYTTPAKDQARIMDHSDGQYTLDDVRLIYPDSELVPF